MRRQTDCPQVAFEAGGALETSSLTNQGMAALRAELRRLTLAAGNDRGDVVAGTAVRVPNRSGWPPIRSSTRQVAAARQEDLAAAEMRAALEELDRVVGAVYTEDVLERIFSRFCIGK